MSCQIEDRVVAKIRERGKIGREEHGASMDRKDVSYQGWLLHHQEELLDAAQYVEAELAALGERLPVFGYPGQMSVKDVVGSVAIELPPPHLEPWSLVPIYQNGNVVGFDVVPVD